MSDLAVASRAVDLLLALLLGLVQGLTEFIPVSSSGHLVLVPYLLGVDPPGLAFDVALHMGTAGAVVVAFRAELWAMARGVLGVSNAPDARLYRKLGWLVLAASVPVAIIGLTFRSAIEGVFSSPLATAAFLLVTAALLVGGERVRDRRVARAAPRRSEDTEQQPVWTGDWVGGDAAVIAPPAPTLPIGEDATDPLGASLEGLSLRRALVIGVVQCIALLPGVSRSGTTIVGGLAAGLTREAATRFSFLLSLPALAGAALLSLPDLGETSVFSGRDIAAGVVMSFVSGLLAIRFLIALVARDRLTGFAKYCVAASLIALLGYAMLGPPSSI